MATTRTASHLGTRVGIVAAGAGAAAVVWALAGLAGGIQTTMGAQPADMALWQVLLAAVVAEIAGWGLLIILEARTRRPRMLWTTAAMVIAALSLSGPLFVAGIETGDRLWLLGIHLVLALAFIPAMSATIRSRDAERAESETPQT